MPNPGYVYILFNSAMPHLVKVGQTTRDPSQRAREIGGTGVPVDFAVAYEEMVQDCVEVERQVHRALAQYRYNPKREFFRLPLKDAIETVRRVAEEERVRWRQEVAIETARRVAEEERVRRRQEIDIETARRVAEDERARLRPKFEPTQRQAPSETPRTLASFPAVHDRTTSSTASPPRHEPLVAHPLPLRWRVLSGLLEALSIGTGLLTVLIVVACCQGLSQSRSAGDVVGGIVASLILIAPLLAVTWFSWKGARRIRSRRP